MKGKRPADKSKKTEGREQALQLKIDELTTDLKRTRADFENYRKRVDDEKAAIRIAGAEKATVDLLPVIDNVERAIAHIPQDINQHPWVKGIESLIKQLDKTLAHLGVARIDSKAGTLFNPELHQAVQMDEDAEGDTEIIDSELQAGYTLNSRVIRHAMVRVTRK